MHAAAAAATTVMLWTVPASGVFVENMQRQFMELKNIKCVAVLGFTPANFVFFFFTVREYRGCAAFVKVESPSLLQ